MTPLDGLVIVAGLLTVAWINWYFFIAERRSATAVVGAGGVQEVTIDVRGGYDPAEVRVRKGTPVRLVFDRKETVSCSEEIVFPEFGIHRFLPPHRRTAVEFTPDESGSYEFTCGMSMLRGRLIVEEE